MFPERPDYLYEVDLRLDDACLETKTFRNFTQRHQFFIPCHKFLTPTTVVSLSARMISGGADAPRFLPPRCLEWVVTTQSGLPQVFLCSVGRRFSVPA